MERREPEMVLPELNLTFLPEEKGVDSLARQIRLTGRAYPLFDIAHLVLKKPDRYHVQFAVIMKDDKPVQPMFVCGIDETLWTSQDDALAYVMEKYFATFYQTEKLASDPPKGTYTFVAQCGMSGVILGPPNFHDYQTKLRKLHSERFSRMPFEGFKARVKIVRDEAVVKKWIEEQSFKNEYVCLNVPEPLRLMSKEEVDNHFRTVHMPEVIKPVDSFTLSGPAAQALPCRPLANLVRRAWDEQRRFPIKLVTNLSQQFAKHGLQFFKVDKTVTHVAVARPHYLDLETTSVSESVKKIFAFIEAHPRCTRRKLIEALVPEGASALAEASAQAEKPGETPPTPPSPEMAAMVSDLHWLIHQGHVIEFANGTMETAKRPAPKPVRVEKKAPKPAAPAEAAAPAASSPEAAAPAEGVAGVEASAPEASAAPEIVPAAAPEAAPAVVVPTEAPAAPSAPEANPPAAT